MFFCCADACSELVKSEPNLKMNTGEALFPMNPRHSQLNGRGNAPRDPNKPQVLCDPVVLDQELLCHIANGVEKGATQTQEVSNESI